MALTIFAERGLQNHGDLGQGWLGKQTMKRGEADLTFANIGVPVAVRTEWLLRIVEVEAAHRVEAEDIVNFNQEALETAPRMDGVTRGEGVAGVDAEADVLFRSGDLPYRRQLLELRAENRPLTGSVFEQDSWHAVRQVGEDPGERTTDPSHALFLTRSEVRPGVKNEAV